MDDKTDKKELSMSKVIHMESVTRQAIYVAIRKGRLKARKSSNGRWFINIKDLDEYRKNKNSRNFSIYDGKPLYDNSKGEYSIKQVAKMLNVPEQKIYYNIRKGNIKTEIKGCHSVIHLDKIKKFKKQLQLDLKKLKGMNYF